MAEDKDQRRTWSAAEWSAAEQWSAGGQARLDALESFAAAVWEALDYRMTVDDPQLRLNISLALVIAHGKSHDELQALVRPTSSRPTN